MLTFTHSFFSFIYSREYPKRYFISWCFKTYKMSDISDHKKSILLEVTCCLGRDNHIIENCCLLRCGGFACKRCTAVSESYVDCRKCLKKHQLTEKFEKSIKSMKQTIDLLIRSNYSLLYEHLQNQFNSKLTKMSEWLCNFFFIWVWVCSFSSQNYM